MQYKSIIHLSKKIPHRLRVLWSGHPLPLFFPCSPPCVRLPAALRVLGCSVTVTLHWMLTVQTRLMEEGLVRSMQRVSRGVEGLSGLKKYVFLRSCGCLHVGA